MNDNFVLIFIQVEVLGVDLSSNMLAIANEHKARDQCYKTFFFRNLQIFVIS